MGRQKSNLYPVTGRARHWRAWREDEIGTGWTVRFVDQDAEFWPKLCSETRSSRIADRSRDGPPLPAENGTPRALRYLPSPPRTSLPREPGFAPHREPDTP